MECYWFRPVQFNFNPDHDFLMQTKCYFQNHNFTYICVYLTIRNMQANNYITV